MSGCPMKLAKLVGPSPYRFAGLHNHRLLYMYMAWFSILPFCECPIALHGFVHIQDIHDHCMSTFINANLEGISYAFCSGESKLGLRILISPTGTYISSQSTSSHVDSTPGILKLEMHVVNSPQANYSSEKSDCSAVSCLVKWVPIDASSKFLL